jgi:hypothetical protein
MTHQANAFTALQVCCLRTELPGDDAEFEARWERQPIRQQWRLECVRLLVERGINIDDQDAVWIDALVESQRMTFCFFSSTCVFFSLICFFYLTRKDLLHSC